MENRTARLTILIDPRKKKLFEEICARQDLNSSQVVRKLMRQYMLDNLADENSGLARSARKERREVKK
jgi:hypothetical protein